VHISVVQLLVLNSIFQIEIMEEKPTEQEETPLESLKKLMVKKDEYEKEIQQLTKQLMNQGVGLKGNLVDKDGFPIDDVNKILLVRELRNKLARFQTDHMEIMKQIEQKMIVYHQQNAISNQEKHNEPETKGQSQPKTKVESSSEKNFVSPQTLEEPFATVDEVSENSPASQGGIQLNDEIIQFGNINKTNHRNLQAVAELVRNSEGKSIIVKVKRRELETSIIKNLTIVPQKWSGRGLLG